MYGMVCKNKNIHPKAPLIQSQISKILKEHRADCDIFGEDDYYTRVAD